MRIRATVFEKTLNNAMVKKGLLVVISSLLIGLLANMKVPLKPVPITGQTLGVLLAGALLGSRLGTLSVILYLIEGAMGMPVFAVSFGPGAFLGPTGGYLIGFIIGAYLVGYLMERIENANILKTFLVMVLGHIVIYLSGVARLSHFTGFWDALKLGVLPFLIGDLFKSFTGAVIVKTLDFPSKIL